jgi:hypothetical protein
LLSLCAVAETVVVDENAVYDPADKDDKLLLDIKSTMSEAERMQSDLDRSLGVSDPWGGAVRPS